MVLVRLMVEAIFLSEGVQKFLFAEALGAGRFAGIGIPAPELVGPAVGGVEIVWGGLILAGYFTRVVARRNAGRADHDQIAYSTRSGSWTLHSP